MRFPLATACALASLLGVVACGGSDTAKDRQTSRFTVRVSGEKGFTVEGAADYEARIGAMTLVDDEEEIELVWAGADMYMRAENEGGKSWFKAPSNIGLLRLLDPFHGFDALREIGDFKVVGTDGVRGTTTTRYRGKVAMGDFLELAPVPGEELSRREASRTFSAEVWVDEEDVLHRVAYDIPAVFGDPAAPMMLEFFDFGVRVEVTLPSRDEVTDEPTAPSDTTGG